MILACVAILLCLGHSSVHRPFFSRLIMSDWIRFTDRESASETKFSSPFMYWQSVRTPKGIFCGSDFARFLLKKMLKSTACGQSIKLHFVLQY